MAIQIGKKTIAAISASAVAIAATTGVVVNPDLITNAVARQYGKPIVKAWLKEQADSVRVRGNLHVKKFEYKQTIVRDSAGIVVDTVASYLPAEDRYNPLVYTTPETIKRVTIEDMVIDSTGDTVSNAIERVMMLQSDSTGLLDVVARIQPSAKPGE